MFRIGLNLKYRVNRLLTDEEKERHLRVNKDVDVPADHALGVIKMNSTYMDTVNKFYIWAGQLTSAALFTIWPIMLGFIIYAIYLMYAVTFIEVRADSEPVVMAFSAVIVVLFLIMLFSGWMAMQECFKWTHYPIRFNRHTRQVYFWRVNGTVAKAGWDDVFFLLSSGDAGAGKSEIHAHILGSDGETVLETFPLAVEAESEMAALGHWEFVRRYMAYGPEESYFDPEYGHYKPEDLTPALLTYCNDIDGKRESPSFSRERIKANYFGASFYYKIAYPFIQMTVLSRIIVMKTCKVPIWPDWVEKECFVAEHDPYVVTAKNNIKFTLKYGEISIK